MAKHGLGRKRDVITHEHLALYPDSYKIKRVEKHPNLAAITQVDLTAGFPEVFDQGQLGSCTAQALLGAYEFEMLKQKEPLVPLSRLYLYYQERLKEGTVASDAGAAIQDGVWVLQKGPGVCREVVWPYDISKFAVRPSATATADAGNHHVVQCQRVSDNLNDLRQILVDGNPIVFGIEVFSSFQSPQTEQTGMIPMPGPHDTLEGGHAIVLVGYDDNRQLFKFRNSWGITWGDAGYGYLPYAYVTNPNLSSDFWVLTAVKDVAPTPTPKPIVSSGTYTSSAPLSAGLSVSFQ